MDDEVLPVNIILRRDPDGALVALFPEEPADIIGHEITCYQRLGQHGAAVYWHVVRTTKPVKSLDESGVPEFLAELRRVGYDPKVYRRQTRQMREAYHRNFREMAEVAMEPGR